MSEFRVTIKRSDGSGDAFVSRWGSYSNFELEETIISGFFTHTKINMPTIYADDEHVSFILIPNEIINDFLIVVSERKTTQAPGDQGL